MGERYSVALDGEPVAQHLGRASAIRFALCCLTISADFAGVRHVVAICEEATDELRACWWLRRNGWAVEAVPGWLDPH